MGFDSGSVSMRRFAVVGHSPKAVDQVLLDRLSEHAASADPLGTPGEVSYSWSGGRHILDTEFSFDNNVFADALHFALRIDTNQIPPEISKAYRLQEEIAVAKGNPSGFISRKQKKEVRETAQRRIDDELRSGKYRRSKLLPILWDMPNGTLYCNAGAKAEEYLQEIFERTFQLTLEPLSAGSLAQRILEGQQSRRDYEDLRPTRFATGPDGEHQPAEYPWVAKGAQAKDFLGNEFALWLWHTADHNAGVITTPIGDASILFDKSLDLDCSFGQTGRDTLRSTGVTRMPEALDALRSGKVPRKAGLILDAFGHQFILTLAAETFTIAPLALPKVEEAENPRVLFEERIAMLRDFGRMLDAMYAVFLTARTGSGWEGYVTTVRKWIAKTSKAVMIDVSPPASRQHQPS
jgi:hypothetical protein